MAVKEGDAQYRYGAAYALGGVVEIDPKTNVALVRMHDGDERVRVDFLRGKSAPPKVGETWIFDQQFDSGWMFVVPTAWTADLAWQIPAIAAPWVSTGAPYAAAGYRKEVEGFVTLCGRLSGGASNTPAFTLAEGYRPKALWAPHNVPITISSAGVVTPTATTVSLDGLRFLAEP